MDNVNKIVITNVFGFFNRGDAVLVEQLVKYIKECFGADCSIEGVASLPEYERKHLPDVLWHERIGRTEGGMIAKAIYHLKVLLFILSQYFGMSIFENLVDKSQREAIQSIRYTDLVISCPGGFFQDSNFSYLSNLIPFFVASLYDKKIIIAPQSIGPIRSTTSKKIINLMFSDVDIICLRENISYDFVYQKLGITKNKLIKTTDLAFYYSYTKVNISSILNGFGISDEEPFVAVSVVNWSFRNSSNAFEDKKQYIEKYSRLLRLLHSEYGYKILAVNQVTSDLTVTEKIAQRTGDYFLIDRKERTPDIMINIIKRSKYFIGSRFHSSIFALLGNTPLITFSYLPKTDGMMEDLRLDDRVFDIYDFSEREMFEVIKNDFSNYSEVKENINDGLQDLKSNNTEFCNILSHFS